MVGDGSEGAAELIYGGDGGLVVAVGEVLSGGDKCVNKIRIVDKLNSC